MRVRVMTEKRRQALFEVRSGGRENRLEDMKKVGRYYDLQSIKLPIVLSSA